MLLLQHFTYLSLQISMVLFQLTPYIGKKLKGVVKKTYLRGQLIYADGEITGQPKGKLLLKNLP